MHIASSPKQWVEPSETQKATWLGGVGLGTYTRTCSHMYTRTSHINAMYITVYIYIYINIAYGDLYAHMAVAQIKELE